MKKKTLALFCAMTMVMGLLAGCAGETESQTQEQQPAQNEAPAEEATQTPQTLSSTVSTKVTAERLVDSPIIYPGIDESIGENINGPSVIRVPDWVENPLGKYYLYFAAHKGTYIRMAYADELTGPWTVYEEGTLQLSDTNLPQENLTLTPEQEAMLPTLGEKSGFGGFDADNIGHSLVEEATTAHIASPDVMVDNENQQIIMYFHGQRDVGLQTTNAAVSKDGIHFEQVATDLGNPYMRVFEVDGTTYGLSMPGLLYKADDRFSGFTSGQDLFNPNKRHHDVLVRGNTLYVFWTQVGDAPEQIYVSTVDISKPWEEWTASDPEVVLMPEYDWEGADMPVEPSQRSTAYGRVNQLRDPDVFEDDGHTYLLYCVAGEAGISIAELTFNEGA